MSPKNKRLHTKQTVCKQPVVAKRPAAETRIAKNTCDSVADAIPTLVVNLARRLDRWNEIKGRLRKWRGFLDFDRVDAVDGSRESISTTDVALTWSTARNWSYVTKVFEGGEDCGYMKKELKMTDGERGCAASHIRIWRQVSERERPLMVLEDDAKPTTKFEKLVKQSLEDLHTEQPDVLYLGYTQAAPWRRRVSACLCEAEYLWTTVGYILWPSGARKLLSALPVDGPVDNFMAKLTSLKDLRAFAVNPEVVKQAKAWNVDNDVAHSDDVAWIQNCAS